MSPADDHFLGLQVDDHVTGDVLPLADQAFDVLRRGSSLRHGQTEGNALGAPLGLALGADAVAEIDPVVIAGVTPCARLVFRGAGDVGGQCCCGHDFER
ncbi:MAG: hypothetical protein CL844_04915 [Crocinitomicaceae bacterium]|nr:hypothetical protein [Crocinitomicaceae bacterium]